MFRQQMDSEINSGFTVTVRNYGAVCTKLEVLYNSKGLLLSLLVSKGPHISHFFTYSEVRLFHPFLGGLEMYSVTTEGICTSIQKSLTSMQAKLIALMPEGLGSTLHS